MDNMNIWNKLSRPPKEALKTISGGRLMAIEGYDRIVWDYRFWLEIPHY